MSVTSRVRWVTERVNGLSLRERGLLFLAVLASVFLVWDFAVMQPIHDRREATQRQLEQVRERIDTLNDSIQAMVRERSRDPDADLESRRRRLLEGNRQLESRIRELHGGVSNPRSAVEVLTRLLAERPGLKVVRLENLPSESLIGSGLEEGDGGGIFIHRVRLVVETDFDGVLEYMGLIEELPDGVYWESLELDVPEWPTNRVEMVLYSLALDSGWIGT